MKERATEKRDWSHLTLEEVAVLAGKERMAGVQRNVYLVLGTPEAFGEAVRRGKDGTLKRVGEVNAKFKEKKDATFEVIGAYSKKEWQAFVDRLDEIKEEGNRRKDVIKGKAKKLGTKAADTFAQGLEIAGTVVEFTVGGVVLGVVILGAAGESVIRIGKREFKALPKELRAAYFNRSAEKVNRNSRALFEAAEAERLRAQRLKMKAGKHKEKAQEIRTKYAKNRVFKVN